MRPGSDRPSLRRGARSLLLPLTTLLLIDAISPLPLRAEAGTPRPIDHVLQLAGVIGPRRTGSEADRMAVDYIRGQMELSGLEVTLQEVETLATDRGEHRVGSRNVLGRLAGDSPETILVSAHHDARGGAIAGANDDASGVAVLLETARRTAARPRRLSYIFASFCAEEDGRIGARAWVRQADLRPLRAMIALELLGDGELLVGPVPGPPPLWAQRRLQQAALETGARGVVSRPLWTLVPRFVDLPYSADHEPFVENGVAAFLLMGTFPAWTYHTTEDRPQRVRPEALDRAVRVLDRMLLDFEADPGPVPFQDPHDLPLMVFGRGVFVPSDVLVGIDLAALLGLALLMLARLRSIVSARLILETVRVVIASLAATSVGLSGLFLGIRLMQLVHGARLPWTAHQGLHVAHAVTLSLLTGWLGLKLFRRIKPTIDPAPYFAAALLLPGLALILALRSGWTELAALPAVTVLSFLGSRFVGSTGRRLALGLLSIVPYALMINLRDYRAAVDLAGVVVSDRILFLGLLALILPVVLYVAHVASFQNCLHSRFWRWLSGGGVGATLGVAWLALAIAAGTLPAYNGRHRQVVRVRQSIDLDQRRAAAMLSSSDTLRDTRLAAPGGTRRVGSGSIERLAIDFTDERAGLDSDCGSPGGPAGRAVLACTVGLRAPIAADTVHYRFTSRSGFRIEQGEGPLVRSYNFIDHVAGQDPVRTFQLQVPPGGDLSLTLRAEFEDDLMALWPQGPNQVFVHQGILTVSRRLLEPGSNDADETVPTPRPPRPPR